MNTINGRTPTEIKKGLECCKPKWEHDRWISCSDDCPFMNEGTFCRIKMQACVSAYIQQLEARIDTLTAKAVLFDEAVAAGERYKRERDAAEVATYYGDGE